MLAFLGLGLIAGLLVLFLGVKLLGVLRLKWVYRNIPGPQCTSFILGNVAIMADYKKRGLTFLNVFQDLSLQYGEIFVFWRLWSPMVFLTNPDAVKTFCSDIKTFRKARYKSERGFDIGQVGGVSFIGTHSILSDYGGPIWEHKKRVLDPAFKILKLQSHIPKLYNIADKVTKNMECMQKEHGYVDVPVAIGPYTIDAITTAGFSVKDEAVLAELKKGLTVLASYFKELIQMSVWKRMQPEVLRGKIQYEAEATENLRSIRNTGKKIVMDRMTDGSYGSVSDALDFIIAANQDAHGNVDMEVCMDDFMTMYEAGNITTSTTLGFVLAELVRNPRVEETLRAEVDKEWTAKGISQSSSNEDIVEALKRMDYLDAVVNETLRKWPPAGASGRILDKDLTICGHDIKSGTNIMVSQYVMHRHPKFWDEPEEFRPERFKDTPTQNYTFFPFLMGPRRCLGKNFALLEIKIFLAHWITKFEFGVAVGKTTKEIQAQQALVYRAINNYVTLTERK